MKSIPQDDPLQATAEGWLAYQRSVRTDAVGARVDSDNEDLFSFTIQVDDLVRHRPEAAWFAIQLIFLKCASDLERACLAAGPLEDLLAKHGAAFIDRVELAASTDPGFKELLTGVWQSGIDPPIWERIQRVIQSD